MLAVVSLLSFNKSQEAILLKMIKKKEHKSNNFIPLIIDKLLWLVVVLIIVFAFWKLYSLKPEFIKSLFVLLGDFAWPVVLLIIFATFRRQIGDLIDRIREFETGSTKFKINPKGLEKAQKISQKNLPNEEAARQLLEEQALEVGELRILRGLVGEGGGREFYSFRRNDYYRPAFDSLVYKGLIFKQENKYLLTPLGTEVVKLHVAKSLGLVSS